MNNIVITFLTFIVAVTQGIFLGLGSVDAAFSNLMTSIGITPLAQLMIFGVICFALALAALRFMAAFFGWLIALILLMMVLYWVTPTFRPPGAPVTFAIETSI